MIHHLAETTLSTLSLPKLTQAERGRDEFLSTLKNDPAVTPYSEDIEKGLNLMFNLHFDQLRPDGVPYLHHTLLVARLLYFRLGVTDPAALIAACLHDAGEDQFERILDTSHEEEHFQTVREKQERAVSLLVEPFPEDLRSDVEKHIMGVTSFPSKELLSGLSSEKASPARDEALHLLRLGSNEDPANLIQGNIQGKESELKNLMYLGHWKKLRAGDALTFAIKIADFFSNGLHRHLLLKSVQELEGMERLKLQKFADKMDKKYGPVVEYLFQEFREASVPVINSRADKYLLGKFRFVSGFYGEVG